MEIVSYKRKKNNVYEVKFDTGDKYDLYDDIILEYELLIDKNIDKKKLEKILQDNSLYDAYYVSLKYINVKMRTKLEVRKYLLKREFSNNVIDYAIDRLIKEGYINEERYIQAYINDSVNLSLIGPRKIIENLKKLGLDAVLVVEYINNVDEKVWIEKAQKIVDKRARVNKVGEALFKNKMMSELSINGFYNEHIHQVIDGIKLETDDIFLREADKTYNKLISKYVGNELMLKFKNKMYLKGFDSEKIHKYLINKQDN